MKRSNGRRASLAIACAACLAIFAASAIAESKPQPALIIDLKAHGMAADLFSDPREDRDQARGLVAIFWTSPDRLAAAFNTSPRYTKPNHPEPFQVRVVVFDAAGKQQASRDWSFGTTGPEGDAMLALEPGPDQTILAVHLSTNGANGIPEGNLVQVLSQELKLVQNFYVPSDSALVPSIPPGSSLVMEKAQATGGAVLQFFSGSPLKPRANLSLAHQTETLAGPDEAAHLVCSKPEVCSEVQVTPAKGQQWSYAEKPPLVPHPRAFLNASTLLVEVEVPEKANRLLLLHADASRTELPALRSSDSVAAVAGVSADGARFALDFYGQSGLCGVVDFGCKHHADAKVFGVGNNSGSIIFEVPLAVQGGMSALSPDGKHLAVLDRGKLLIYALP
jgi:hypothetical protein